MTQLYTYDASHAFLVKDNEFAPVFSKLARECRESVHTAYFLASASVVSDSLRSHREALVSLVRAGSLGVTIKTILGHPNRTRSLVNNNSVARFLRKRGIPVRIADEFPFHYKFSVFDSQWILVGSHNLTVDASNGNKEISIAIRSESMANRLIDLHDRLWSLSSEMG